jgi:hypothetical protein
MAKVTVGEICDAVATTLSATTGLARTQSYNQLTEGMNTLPTLQVYPETWEVSAGSETDRIAFVDAATGVPGHRFTEMVLHLDLYVRQRSQLAEDWGEAVDLASELHDKLDEEGSCPLFSQVGIRTMHWTATRVVFEYGSDARGQPLRYAGFRFELTVRIF